MEPVFSSGLYLANLAVSSNILIDSWNAIHGREEPETIIDQHPHYRIMQHPDYNIIAFVGLSISDIGERSGLVPVSKISDFKLLRSDTHTSFSINEAAFSQFNTLQKEFTEAEKKIKDSFKPKETGKKKEDHIPSATQKKEKKDHIPYIITGECLNGSVASLFTWSLLKTLDQTQYKLPLCITFGSPLLGDTAFQQAVSCNPTWNSCFLHVVHKDDRIHRSLPTTGQGSYKPFGTLLLCSESSYACFQDPESVIELFKCESLGIQTANYENVVKSFKETPFRGNVSSFPGHAAIMSNIADSHKAGIAAQVLATGLWHPQEDESLPHFIDDIEKHEKGMIKRQMEEFDPAKELNEMKVYLAFMEWYMDKCRANGQGPGYYDSFKNAQEQRDSSVDKYKTYLTVYWEKVVEDAEKKPHLTNAPLQKRYLYGGKNYRRIVEPLDIAEYYSRGRKDYMTRGRSEHYKRLEEWLEKHEKGRKKGKETQDGPSKPKVDFVTEDSCFWARVEDAIRSCRWVDRARAESSDDSEGKKPFDFEDYVMNLIKEQKVSPDILLEKSSYMQWWREYREILEEKSRQGYLSCDTELVSYMREGDYETYGKPSPINSTVNPSDKSHLGPSTSRDPQG